MGQPYTARFEATRTPECSWAPAIPEPTTARWELTSGALPQGLQFSGDGVLGGTPAQEGRFELTVSADCGSGTATRDLTLVVKSPSAGSSGEPAVP